MSTFNTETLESDDEPTSTPSQAITFLTRRTKDGSLPLIAGTSLFVHTVQKRENRGRVMVQALAATALVGIGIHQRRSQQTIPQTLNEHDGHDEKTGTSEQRAESHRPDTNPRGTSNEPDVETKTEPDEGSIQFTESQESQPNPDLDEQSPEDPRPHDEEDTTDIDLSEASMADEASEAVGPSSGQSQPTQLDDTEPEEMPEEEGSHWSEMDDTDDERGEDSR